MKMPELKVGDVFWLDPQLSDRTKKNPALGNTPWELEHPDPASKRKRKWMLYDSNGKRTMKIWKSTLFRMTIRITRDGEEIWQKGGEGE